MVSSNNFVASKNICNYLDSNAASPPTNRCLYLDQKGKKNRRGKGTLCVKLMFNQVT